MEWIRELYRLSAANAPVFAVTLVVAGALWIGTLFSVSWLCGQARIMADAEEIGRVARTLFRRWTTPSLLVSLVAAAGLLAAPERARSPWLYGVAVGVVALIALHVTVGHRASRIERGSVEATKGDGVRRLVLLLSLGAIVALAGFHSSFVP